MCGCGGSTARQQVARPAQREGQEQTPRPAVSYGDPGFVWTGPPGATVQPAVAETQRR